MVDPVFPRSKCGGHNSEGVRIFWSNFFGGAEESLKKMAGTFSWSLGHKKVYGCFQKEGFSPKMDGEHNGKPYYLMDDLGGKHHYFWKHLYFVEKQFRDSQKHSSGSPRQTCRVHGARKFAPAWMSRDGSERING